MFKTYDEQEDRLTIMDLVELGQIEAVKKLLATDKYDVNQQDKFGNCAVLMAAIRNDLEILKVLQAAGARLDIEDHFKNTPLKWAKENENDEMVNFINKSIKQQIKHKV